MHFKYVLHANKKNYLDETIVFQTLAKGILEADMLYIKVTGNDPAKQNNVGCEVTALEFRDMSKEDYL